MVTHESVEMIQATVARWLIILININIKRHSTHYYASLSFTLNGTVAQ